MKIEMKLIAHRPGLSRYGTDPHFLEKDYSSDTVDGVSQKALREPKTSCFRVRVIT
jgi:hypothetical protein